MIVVVTVLGIIGLLIGVMALACASANGFSVTDTIRQTFIPLSKKEFWLPPCPFCWGVRAVAAAALVVMFVPVG